MGRRIALIQGHPDPRRRHLGHSLADACAHAAEAAGHDVRHIDVVALDFPVLQSKEDFNAEAEPDDNRLCQDIVARAEHLVISYPMWISSMPALFYRWYFGAHGVRNLKRNILGFCGVMSIAASLIGSVESAGNSRRKTWFARMRKRGCVAR